MRMTTQFRLGIAGLWLATVVMGCATMSIHKPESNNSAGVMIASLNAGKPRGLSPITIWSEVSPAHQ